jgi:septal ring factor EnvC (AmiA/AmiB activator)
VEALDQAAIRGAVIEARQFLILCPNGEIVTYADYRSDYGKVVEIDHGNGIATLHGHLHRYLVSVGQRVAEHEQIGFLGSSGRSVPGPICIMSSWSSSNQRRSTV